MVKKLTLVLRVSDDTAAEMQSWVGDHNRQLMFMGNVIDVLHMDIGTFDDTGGIRFLPGSPEAAEYLGTNHWTDSQGNVHWRNREARDRP